MTEHIHTDIMTKHGSLKCTFFKNRYTFDYFNISLYYNSDKLYAINTFTNSVDSVHTPYKMLDQLKDYINLKDGICINGYFYDTSEMSLRDFISLCKMSIYE